MQFIIRYAEIALKGQNRPQFTHQLEKNIAQKLPKAQISRPHAQLILASGSHSQKEVEKNLSQTFGIAWFAPIQSLPTPTTLNSLYTQVRNLYITSSPRRIHRFVTYTQPTKPKTFAVRATRTDKSLPYTSKDVENKIGDLIRKKLGLQVDLDNPDLTFHLDLHPKKTHLYTQKIPGPGGLPVKTSGKILLLLSGGFDSAATAYLLAKRGAQVDYLHFHTFPQNQKIKDTKIPQIVKKLASYTLSSTLHLAPYHPFQLATLKLDKRQEKHELLVFRRLMLSVASRLAEKKGYQALATGDSLGQVASQTLSNLKTASLATPLPIFRPLIGYDKQEIIDLLRGLELEKVINQPYKDCCSIISENPATIAHPEKVKKLEKKLKTDKITKEILAKTTTFQTT